MNVQKVLVKIRNSGLELYLDKGLLRADSKHPVNDKQRQYLKQHKTEIIRYLELESLQPMNQNEEKAIRSWLTHIEETNSELIDEVMTKCRSNMDDRRYFLSRSTEAECTV